MLTRILPDANNEYIAQQEQEMDQAAADNAQEAEAIGYENGESLIWCTVVMRLEAEELMSQVG